MTPRLFLIIALTTTMLVTLPTAQAEIDPQILIKLATKAQSEVNQQISSLDVIPEKVEEMNEKANKELESLRNSVENNDVESAKKHFLSVMRIYKAMSQLIGEQTQESTQMASQVSKVNPNSELERLKEYVFNLKSIAKKHNAAVDFSGIDELFTLAENQIQQNNFSDAQETINKIKHEIVEINKELRKAASQQASDRAKKFAQKYLTQLDRLIVIAEKRGVSDKVLDELKETREKLSTSSDPNEIIKEVRKILSIKEQFELTKVDRIESRISQVEKSLSQLSKLDHIDDKQIQILQDSIDQARALLDKGDIEGSNELLKSIAEKINELKESG
ncbi:MAG: hypothetical protein GWN01_13420 [Nitrosopumilaceae archaeon]|nr:hypothetical protein [Nitrosopumilaceae archaeon]NIU01863.1 hypothetical protein [Nitrosopumilaceae archaeon]NIU88267.1 hypothetical protein [Nitrosopumilaceae archaeon]NIV66559.1 hypothetical protein [Nitrosopumilaceae archaeon]NIX62464.1 hypothetical protein [Nitrosopumilaceae archaeon]